MNCWTDVRSGRPSTRLQRDMQGADIAQILEQDIADANVLGVRKTPAFFVNGRGLHSFGLPQLEALVASQVGVNY
jgi:protein-disulfide isomerase